MDVENKQYLTKGGLKKLEQELGDLKRERDVKKKDEAVIPSSQTIDSEFATFQEGLNLLEARIDELDFILKNYALIILPPTYQRRIVNLGATVLLEVEGQKTEFTIVGPIEANPMLGRISHESPVGNSLLGSKVGDEVKVQSAVKTIYKVKKIIYKEL